MLVRRVIQHQLGDDPNPAAMRLFQELLEIAQTAIRRMDIGVIRDVVPIVFQWRWAEWQQPDRGDAKVFQVVELLGEAPEVADPVSYAVVEGPDMQLIDNGVFVPGRISAQGHRSVSRKQISTSDLIRCTFWKRR